MVGFVIKCIPKLDWGYCILTCVIVRVIVRVVVVVTDNWYVRGSGSCRCLSLSYDLVPLPFSFDWLQIVQMMILTCKPIHVDLCRYFYFRLWPVSTVAQQLELGYQRD
jgi:hypothetical protein